MWKSYVYVLGQTKQERVLQTLRLRILYDRTEYPERYEFEGRPLGNKTDSQSFGWACEYRDNNLPVVPEFKSNQTAIWSESRTREMNKNKEAYGRVSRNQR